MSLMQPQHWPGPAQWLLAFALGALGVLAFAPFHLGLLAVFAPALWLHLVWHAPRTAAAARLGYAFGLGLLGFGVFWLRISIDQFGGVSTPLAIAFTLLFVALIALYFALAAALMHRLARAHGKLMFMLLIAPLSWLLVEWLRGWLFTGFPWLSLGYSQLDLPLAGFAPLIGVFGVGALVIFSAGLLNLWRRAWPSVVLLALWASGLGLSWLDWSEPAGKPFTASLVQGNIAQEDKWRRSMFEPTLALYRSLTAQARDSQLVIWPETAIPGFEQELEHSVLAPLHQQMRGEGRDLLTGIVAGQRGGAYYNAMISLGESGRGAYHKRHLVPFGEYFPLQAVIGPVLDFLKIPMSNFSVGVDRKPLISLAGYQAGIDICYEDAFAGEVMRALPEAHFLVNASNDAWFGDSLAPHQHLQIARMRALESSRYLLRATNTGISAIIDQRGEIRGLAPQFQQMLLSGQVQPLQGMTPYARWGDTPLVVLAGLLLLMLWRRGRSA